MASIIAQFPTIGKISLLFSNAWNPAWPVLFFVSGIQSADAHAFDFLQAGKHFFAANVELAAVLGGFPESHCRQTGTFPRTEYQGVEWGSNPTPRNSLISKRG